MKKTPMHHSFMEKLSNKQRTAVHLAVGLILLLLASYCLRGWLRVTVVPAVVTAVHGSTMQRDMDAELASLQEPMHLLGYSQVDVAKTKCSMVAAQGFKEEITCVSTLHAYTEMPKDDTSKQTLSHNAAQLQTRLQQRSWDGEFTDTAQTASLTLLINNLNKGIDYTPDAAYMKPVGDSLCIIDTSTAFSSPKPPAMATQISCSKAVQIFGTVMHTRMYSE